MSECMYEVSHHTNLCLNQLSTTYYSVSKCVINTYPYLSIYSSLCETLVCRSAFLNLTITYFQSGQGPQT